MDPVSERLLGSWTLERWEIRYEDGRAPVLPFGEDAEGLLLYGADGWMSATMSRRTRVVFPGDLGKRVDFTLKARAFDEYLAYVARWHVEGDVAIHAVRWAMNPTLIGTRQERRVAFVGPQQLVLSAEERAQDGRRRSHAIAWRRD